MSKSEEPSGSIHERMAWIMQNISHIGKNQRNQHQRFQFRGIDDVLNTLHGPFAQAGVVVTPKVISHEVNERKTAGGKPTLHHISMVEYSFVAPDGSSVSTTVVGEAMDNGDKGAAKCLSIALKSAMFQVLLIPVEGQEDPDAESHVIEETPATKSQLNKVDLMIKEMKLSEDEQSTLLKWCGADSIESMTKSQAAKAIEGLQKKQEQQSK